MLCGILQSTENNRFIQMFPSFFFSSFEVNEGWSMTPTKTPIANHESAKSELFSTMFFYSYFHPHVKARGTIDERLNKKTPEKIYSRLFIDFDFKILTV